MATINWLAAGSLWEQAITAPVRDVSCRWRVVDLQHRPVTVLDRYGDPLGDVPLTAGDVEMNGESDQVWSCRLTIEDERWVPRSWLDPLHPLSPYRLAGFWLLKLADDLWGELEVGVYRTGRPKITDTGAIKIDVDGQDVLSVAKRGGYGGQVVDVGGLTADAALNRLFATVAPTVPFRAEPSTVVLPATYQLGRRKPSEDWTEIAGMAGQVVRADRQGYLTSAQPPDPGAISMRLIEGPDCRMSGVSRELSDTVYNRVVVNGTSPSLTTPVFGIDEDKDETSPTYVGRFGPYELQIDSDAVTTNEAAVNLAKMHRGRYRRPAETVSGTIRPRPDRNYRDLVDVARLKAGIAGPLRVSGWSMPQPVLRTPPGNMTMRFMSRQGD